MSRTVRDVLEDGLRGYAAPDQIADLLADLRTVLTSGHVWRLREVPADQLLVGDIISDKRGLLWAITTIGTHDDPADLGLVIVRGDVVKPVAFTPDHPVQVLLAAQDVRAIELLERELGATSIGREAAA